jgi:hypothetical protein
MAATNYFSRLVLMVQQCLAYLLRPLKLSHGSPSSSAIRPARESTVFDPLNLPGPLRRGWATNYEGHTPFKITVVNILNQKDALYVAVLVNGAAHAVRCNRWRFENWNLRSNPDHGLNHAAIDSQPRDVAYVGKLCYYTVDQLAEYIKTHHTVFTREDYTVHCLEL